jgi:flagellar basal-body rod protein FlgB
MYENLDVFRMSSAMARHAAARQAVIATNLANADTPGYEARSLPEFSSVWSRDGGETMRVTRPGHIVTDGGFQVRASLRASEPSPNGNNVSIEAELLASVDAQREHGRALAILRHGIGLIRSSLGR